MQQFHKKELSTSTHIQKKQKIDLHNTKQFIKNHKMLLITKADKGNATVVIEKTVYLDEMNTLLQDERYYKKLKGDPLLSLEKQTANYIKQLNSKNFMGDDTKIEHKITQKCNTSKAYGLIKIHKQGFPVRPIISTINSPTYNLSKFFSQFLQSKLKKPKSHIDNSLELKLKIEKMKIPPGFEIISLDVVSLFTNVSNELIYAAIEKRWPYLYHYVNMSCSEFIDVIKFILIHNHFQFNNVFYTQIFGSAMGNPISPILADIVMHDLENFALSKLCFESVFYFRHVDDILLCVPSNMIEYTKKHF